MTLRAVRSVVLSAFLAAGFGCGLALPAAAQDDPIAGVRADAQQLVAQERYGAALRLLRAIDLRTLPEERVLELKAWIASIEARKDEAIRRDFDEARKLSEQGKHDEALAALADIETYGDSKDVERAEAERTRIRVLLAAAEAEAAEAARRADEEAARQAKAAARRAEKEAAAHVVRIRKDVKAWLKKRKQLICSTCRGVGRRRCTACDGRGRTPQYDIKGRMSWVDCRSCQAGSKKCKACKETGINRTRLDDVLYDPLAPSVKAAVAPKRTYVDGLFALIRGEDEIPESTQRVTAQLGFALTPIVAHSDLEITHAVGSETAVVRYGVDLGGNGRVETLNLILVEGDWCIAVRLAPGE